MGRGKKKKNKQENNKKDIQRSEDLNQRDDGENGKVRSDGRGSARRKTWEGDTGRKEPRYAQRFYF